MLQEHSTSYENQALDFEIQMPQGINPTIMRSTKQENPKELFYILYKAQISQV